jgi:hypothetical protein
LEDLLDSAGSTDEFRKMLVDENVLMLEDRSPANRARAFLFLQGRGIELGEYDPLAPRRERQAALKKIMAGTVDESGVDSGAGASAAGGGQ